jgi:phosphoglycolate phosphatase-like HAD superfamily hydrolase
MFILRNARLIFWDFDGVVKNSIEVKAEAFAKLFEMFGETIVSRVREHHLANGGMSRFDKLPIYLGWAGIEPSESRVRDYCEQFGKLVLQGVIDSSWVGGSEAYLRSNTYQQTFVLVSATPQDELQKILSALNLATCFTRIFGAPTRKHDAIQQTLATSNLDPHDCLMIGDARADLEAAAANQVPFLLRRHKTNSNVFADYFGPSVEDFTSS